MINDTASWDAPASYSSDLPDHGDRGKELRGACAVLVEAATSPLPASGSEFISAS